MYQSFYWNRNKTVGILIAGFLSRFRNRQAPPIFIVGCGHSGTSVLLAILGSHSGIHAIPYESDFASGLSFDDPRSFHQAAARVRSFDRFARAAGKGRWVEKTPRHIERIPHLLKLVPRAKVILMIRDGRDVARSIQCRTGDLQSALDRWIIQNRVGQNYWDWPQIYRLRYESLVENFDAAMAELTQFLGVKVEPAMRDFHLTPRRYFSDVIAKPPDSSAENHNQYRNWQINQPLFDGRGRWKEFSDDERHLVKRRIGGMLTEYGYAEREEW